MKKTLTILGILFFVASIAFNFPTKTIAAPAKAEEVNWMEWDKAQAYMKQTPKKAYIDMYTTWCHWCKVMDKQTLSNPNVVKYLNENFYAVRFNAESKEDVVFNGKTYKYDASRKAHELAIELMNGKLTFPTSVFLEEGFNQPQPVPGYLKINDMEMILKYMAEGKNKTMPWTKWQEDFKPEWK